MNMRQESRKEISWSSGRLRGSPARWMLAWWGHSWAWSCWEWLFLDCLLLCTFSKQVKPSQPSAICMDNGLLHMCLGSVSLYDLSPTPTFTGFSLTSCFMHANLLSESSDLYRYFRPDPQTWFHFFHITDIPISQVATKGWNKHLP